MVRVRDRVPSAGPMLAVFTIALILRLHPWAPGWGIRAGRYDDAAYYATAVGWVSGRLPYRDMLLIQPPGLIELLAPLAFAGRWLGDANAYLASQLLWNALGAATAAVCFAIGRRHSPLSGWVAGVAYAAFPGALYADLSISLETPAALATAVAFWLLLRRESTRRDFALAGAALGVALSIKIIWAAVIAWVVLWTLWRHRNRVAPLLLAGSATTIVACGGFFALSPEPMWRMVIVDQLGRPSRDSSLAARLWQVAGIPQVPKSAPVLVAVVAIALAILFGYALWRCVRAGQYLTPGAALAALVALVAAPSSFPQYPAVLAVPLAVTVGYAVARQRVRRPAVAALVAAAAIGIAASLPVTSPGTVVPEAVRAAVAGASGCATTDNPAVLIAADSATTAARSGCPYWPDVTGVTYDRLGGKPEDGQAWGARADRPAWQAALLDYLDAGSVIVLNRPSTGLSEDTRARLENARTVTQVGRFTVMTS